MIKVKIWNPRRLTEENAEQVEIQSSLTWCRVYDVEAAVKRVALSDYSDCERDEDPWGEYVEYHVRVEGELRKYMVHAEERLLFTVETVV